MLQKVLLTGASGFIGKYVTKDLIKYGYEVVVLQHYGSLKEEHEVTVIKADICDEYFVSLVAEKVKKCDVVIHLAADIDIIGSDKTIQTNCIGTYHLTKLAKMLYARKFIFMSSIPVIGKPVELPITENHNVNPKTLYHITKYMGELIIKNECDAIIDTLIYRISSPIGIGMSSDNYLSFLIKKCIEGDEIELYGKGMRVQNYIDVRDIARSVICGLSSKQTGMYLIAGNEGISNRELAFLCKKITGASSNIIWGRKNDPEEGDCWNISNKKAMRELNFSPTYTIRDTIEWIFNAYRKEQGK